MHHIILISLHRILHIQNAQIIYDKASNSTEHTKLHTFDERRLSVDLSRQWF